MAALGAAASYGRDAGALRRLAAMDVEALMGAGRESLPVRSTATVLTIEPVLSHPSVGPAQALTIRVDPTQDSGEFEVRTSVLASTLVPSVGQRLVVSFRVDAAHDVAIVGRVAQHPSQRP